MWGSMKTSSCACPTQTCCFCTSCVAWEEPDGKGGLLAAAGLKCDLDPRLAGLPENPKVGTKRKEYDGKRADEDDCVVVDDDCAGAGGAAGAGAGGTRSRALAQETHGANVSVATRVSVLARVQVVSRYAQPERGVHGPRTRSLLLFRLRDANSEGARGQSPARPRL